MADLQLKRVESSKYQVGDVVLLKKQEGLYLVTRIHARYNRVSYELVPLCETGWSQMLEANDIERQFDCIRNRLLEHMVAQSTMVMRKRAVG